MTLFHDFEPEPTPDDAEAAAPPPLEPPRVVVQYRGRSLAWAMIVPVAIAASVVTWVAIGPRGEDRSAAPRRPTAARPVESAPAPVVLKVAALPARLEPVPEPTVETIPLPGPEPPPVPPIEARAAAVEEAVAAAETPTADDTKEAMAAIRDEAEKALAAKVEMERLRATLPALEAQARIRALRVVESQRWEFHRGVQALLRERGDSAATAIWDLAIRFPFEDDPVSDQAIQAELKDRGPRLDRAARIALFRRHGLPEPVILAELVREQRRLMPSRKGPRTREEAILRAAKQLLSVPPRHVAPAAGPVGRGG